MCCSLYVVLTVALIGFAYSSELRDTKEMRHGRFFFDLLGYIHGFKIGKEYALQLTPIYIPTPIIIVPSNNQQQSVSVQKSTTEENYQEMGDAVQTITTSARLIDTTISSFNNDVDIIRKPPKREVGSFNEVGQLKQDTTTILNSNETPTTATAPDINQTGLITEPTTSLIDTNGKYPAAAYNMTIDNLTITTEPSMSFTSTSANESKPVIVGVNRTQSVNYTSENAFWSKPNYPSSNPNGAYGVPYPYPAATYNNAFLNQLMLTTDVSKNEESLPPEGDQRWQQFTSFKNNFPMKEGFRPLAGLYYDGFLHTPLLMKNGWTPYFK